MTFNTNPFVELYMTESISAAKFVKLFSPALLSETDTHALFQSGNVILSGLQGSGKTALLNLLRPEILIAYRESGIDWPLPPHCSRFLSAGINLSKSSAMDFGERPFDSSSVTGRNHLMYFTDFLNYWIVEDLLNSLQVISDSNVPNVKSFLEINSNEALLDDFARYLSSLPCWHGGLPSINSFSDLRDALVKRIYVYRNYLNYNIDELPRTVRETKTSAGDPISFAVEALRQFRIIPVELPVLIRIDQFEDLMGLEAHTHGARSGDFRKVIFKMLGRRDQRLSYRIGARPYSLIPDMKMSGTDAAIEELRNFKTVDIDGILQRREHSVGPFPKFAEDVVRRRLGEAGYPVQRSAKSLLTHIFGSRPTPQDRVNRYVRSATAASVVTLEADWPANVTETLTNLSKEDPISAKLGEAWYRQESRRSIEAATIISDRPWESTGKKWWKKERIDHALLQIAAARHQRMAWSGAPDIIALSGGNILVFLNICQLIWAEYLRRSPSDVGKIPFEIDPIVQDMGIQEASAYWFRKMQADPYGGDERYRFASVVADQLRTRMRDDRNMSYPGANGFSLSERELDKRPDVSQFLDNCFQYGVLSVQRHTPKTKSRGQSKKWYLFPILSPYFQLPVVKTKEPLYANLQLVEAWLQKADVNFKVSTKVASPKREKERHEGQLSFPGMVKGDEE